MLDDDIISDASGANENTLIGSKAETISILREQLQAEREAHAEARRIIAALTQRIPELETPSAAREHPEMTGEEPERV